MLPRRRKVWFQFKAAKGLSLHASHYHFPLNPMLFIFSALIIKPNSANCGKINLCVSLSWSSLPGLSVFPRLFTLCCQRRAEEEQDREGREGEAGAAFPFVLLEREPKLALRWRGGLGGAGRAPSTVADWKMAV